MFGTGSLGILRFCISWGETAQIIVMVYSTHNTKDYQTLWVQYPLFLIMAWIGSTCTKSQGGKPGLQMLQSLCRGHVYSPSLPIIIYIMLSSNLTSLFIMIKVDQNLLTITFCVSRIILKVELGRSDRKREILGGLSHPIYTGKCFKKHEKLTTQRYSSTQHFIYQILHYHLL